MANGGICPRMPRWRRRPGAQPILLEDGDILSLAPGRAEVIDSAPVGRLVLDGTRLMPIGGGVMTARRRMLFNGVVVAASRWMPAGGCAASHGSARRACSTPDDPELDRVAANSPMRSRICRQRCVAMMRRWPMPRVRRCGARWGGGCRSGPWSMCICSV